MYLWDQQCQWIVQYFDPGLISVLLHVRDYMYEPSLSRFNKATMVAVANFVIFLYYTSVW